MFYFVEEIPPIEKGVRTVIISKRIFGTRMLFRRFKDDLQFPKGFGYNFHAFWDWMTQLYYWFPEKEVRIYHKSLPLLLKRNMKEYIDILNLIDAENEKFPEHAEIAKRYSEKHPEAFMPVDGLLPWWDYRPKVFNVYFLHQDEQYVKKLLSDYSWDYRKCISFNESGTEQIDYKFRYTS